MFLHLWHFQYSLRERLTTTTKYEIKPALEIGLLSLTCASHDSMNAAASLAVSAMHKATCTATSPASQPGSQAARFTGNHSPYGHMSVLCVTGPTLGAVAIQRIVKAS